jgi:hypothetical protein
MSEPDDLDKLTEELNAAARSERPTDERKAAILEAIIGKGGPRGGGGPPKTLAAVVAALVLVLLGGLAWRERSSPMGPPSEDPSVIPTTVMATGGGSTAAPLVQPPPPPARVEPAVPSEVAPEPPPPEPPPEVVKRTVPPPVLEEPDALAKEVRLVDAARAELPADPRSALALLERHRREFPKGALRVEAELVRLEAHLRAGERSKAQAIIDRLTRGAPEGPVAARARRLFEEIP